MDSARRGLYLRKVQHTLLDVVQYAGALEALNFVGATGQSITWQESFWQASSTATLTNFKQVWASAKPSSGSPLADSAQYVYDTTDANSHPTFNGAAQLAYRASLTDTSSKNLEIGTAQSYVSAIVTVGAHGAPKDEGGVFLVTSTAAFLLSGTANVDDANTAAKLCVYKDGTAVKLLNNLGETVTYVVSVVATT